LYAVYYIRGVEEQNLTAEEREALTTTEVSILCGVFFTVLVCWTIQSYFAAKWLETLITDF